MKKKIAIIVGDIIVIVAIIVAIFTGSIKVNGVKCKITDNIEENLSSYYYNDEPQVFKDSDIEKMFVTYNFYGDLLEKNFVSRILDTISRKEYKVEVVAELDSEKFKDYITSKEYSNNVLEASKDAKIVKENGYYHIEKEVIGNILDEEKLINDLKNKRGISLSDYIIKPNIVEEDLKPIVDKLNSIIDWSVTYSNGKSIKCSEDYVSYSNKKQEIVIDYSFLRNNIKNVTSSYSTVGKERDFTTTSGKNIKVSGGTFGVLVDYDKEYEFLKKSLEEGTSISDRVPELTSSDEIGDTYLEVNIEDQHIWYYKDSELIKDSDIVTGAKGRNDTPKGVYFICERVNGKWLNGSTWHTWVNKWMRLTWDGIGLHDATWRGSFGGSIYKSNGSHGCINLPKDFATYLYDNTYYGMPVIIY